MASIDWQKQTKQKAGAMKRHLGRKEREEVNHSNPDIDKSKSHLNYYIGCNDYDEAYRRMCDRVKAVDKLYPPKKVRNDRIVCASLEVPCPLIITEQGRSREFFEAAYGVLQDFFGMENVCGACVHLDEVHKYIDSKDGQEKTSLEHETILVAAYAEWSEKDKAAGNEIERKGINGKHFETKARLKALNKAMCEMVRETFGVEYNTGEGARKKTAEILKAETELVTAKIAKENAEAEFAKIKQQNEEYIRSLEPTPTKKVKTLLGEKEVQKSEEELQRDRDILAAQAVIKNNEERKRKLDERESGISIKEQALSRRAEGISKKEKSLALREKSLSELQKNLSDRERKIKTGELLQARYIAEKILKNFGVKTNRFDVQRELERQSYNKQDLQSQKQKGR